MLASTKETDNSTMFYLLKKKIEANKSRKKSPTTVFIPISNEEYTGKILKKSEIEDVENCGISRRIGHLFMRLQIKKETHFYKLLVKL